VIGDPYWAPDPVAAFRTAVDIPPRHLRIAVLPRSAITSGDSESEAALASARAAVDLDPSQVVAQYIVGAIEFDRGHYDSAETAFAAVARERQWAAAGALQLARVKLASGHPADAIAFAESAGDGFMARLTLARALIADGQVARARVELRRLATTNATAPELAVLLGSLALAEGNVREARAEVTRALTLAPDSADALMLAARTAISEGDTASAEQYLTRAVAAPRNSFDAHRMLADLYVSRGDLARAEKTLEQYIDQHDDAAAARTALGIVLQAANRPDAARAAYEQAIALDPADSLASARLARLYASDEASVPRALELARTAAASLPNDADVHDTLGWIAFRAGRLSLAVTELERAVALNNREPLYQAHLRTVRTAVAEAAKTAAEVEAARAAEAARALKSEQ